MLRSFAKIPTGREIAKVNVKLIKDNNWFGQNAAGRGLVLTTGSGQGSAGPTPPDHIMLAYGSCFGGSVKHILEDNGIKVKDLTVEMEAEWELVPHRRIKEFRSNCIIEADGLTQEMADAALKQASDEVCMVANTLKRSPKITVK